MGKKKAKKLALKRSTKASSKDIHRKVSPKKKTAKSSNANSVREDTERLKFALLTSRIGIWEMDLKSKHIVWDAAVYIIFGLERSAFKNTFKEYIDLIHPDDRAPSKKIIESAIQNNVEFHVEHRIIRGGSDIVWIEGKGKAILNKKGEPVKLIGTVAEITSRKNAEIALQKRDLLFNALSEATKELVIHTNLNDAINLGLSKLGEAIEIDRVYLFENDQVIDGHEPATSQRFEWNSGSAEPQINNPDLQHFPLSQFEPCTSILESGQHFASHLRNMDDNVLKEVLSAQQIKSVLFFPILIKNAFWGFVGFDACKTEMEWSSIQLSALRSYSAAISGALENKLSENEKQEWKTRYELIAASSGQVIYEYDIKSGNIVWGGNVKELLGYSKREMGDINQWIAMIHPDDRDASIQQLDESEKNLSHYDVVYQFCHKDGHYLTMHDSGFFLTDDDGKAYRMLGMMRDITEMKKAEDELKESEERYRTFLGASFSGIGIHDLGVFIEVNQGLADVSGYSVEELIGMQSLQLVAPEYRPMVIDRIKSGDETPYDIEAIHKNGSKRYLEIHGKNIPYKNNIVRVTEFRDVTDRKIAEEKILEQNERLSSIAQSLTKKNDQLEEFTQIVSHNLRSPVGNIMSLVAILGGSNEVDERNKVLKLLERSSNYLLTTLNELNDILKVKQDIHLEKQNIKFEEVFEKVKQMMTVRINETSVQLICDFETAPEINYPNIYLESIFLNLLSNSLKYRNPNRTLEVNFRTYYSGQQLFMEVSDNGLGIDLNRYRHQVFKLRKTFHENAESRGVGLFLIKTQIETMGGEINISSEENVGTTFVINFNKEDS